MRIQNLNNLISHGNCSARRDALDILEAGLTASDPYYNTLKLIRLKGKKLVIGAPEFEAADDPNSGYENYEIDDFEHIYVIGAGKGVQRIAKALEDVLGDHLTGGHVIAKYGDPVILNKISVTEGSHPTPDQNCVEGCKKIIELSQGVTEKDLVFIIITNGGSSLLTMPEEGVSLEETIRLTQIMQIEKGANTRDLNCIRNHIDKLKGGKLLRLFKKARLINIMGADLNHIYDAEPKDYSFLVHNNYWLHNAPDGTTYDMAVRALEKYDAWEACPDSIRRLLRDKKVQGETLKYEEYKTFRSRMFGIMPEARGFYEKALDRARELGYTAYLMSENIGTEAAHVGGFLASVAECISRRKEAMSLPAALIFTGELLVSVGKAGGVGGRNQECALAFAERISGNDAVVCACADTDGTDGPGGYIRDGIPYCLSGAVVDGCTASEIAEQGYDISKAIRTHAATEPLWCTDNGILAEQGISLNDLIVVLILPK